IDQRESRTNSHEESAPHAAGVLRSSLYIVRVPRGGADLDLIEYGNLGLAYMIRKRLRLAMFSSSFIRILPALT
ncbi:MAG: hypothetical protein WC378_19370, partial [Opitutaceae bacterium]